MLVSDKTVNLTRFADIWCFNRMINVKIFQMEFKRHPRMFYRRADALSSVRSGVLIENIH